MNQQHNTLVPYMTCKNLRPSASTRAVSLQIPRARVHPPPLLSTHPRRFRAESRRCSRTIADARAQTSECIRRTRPRARRTRASSSRSPSMRRVLSPSGRRSIVWTRLRDARARAMSDDAPRRLLTLDDITPRLRGATMRETRGEGRMNASCGDRRGRARRRTATERRRDARARDRVTDWNACVVTQGSTSRCDGRRRGCGTTRG